MSCLNKVFLLKDNRGLGLSTLKELTDSNENVLLDTVIENGYFVQKVEINNKES